MLKHSRHMVGVICPSFSCRACVLGRKSLALLFPGRQEHLHFSDAKSLWGALMCWRGLIEVVARERRVYFVVLLRQPPIPLDPSNTCVIFHFGHVFCLSARFALFPSDLCFALNQASERVMMWGTSTIFQLKAAVKLKAQVERLQMAASRVGSKSMPKMDPAMYKEIMGGALGGVFLLLNSPNMGKVSDVSKS